MYEEVTLGDGCDGSDDGEELYPLSIPEVCRPLPRFGSNLSVFRQIRGETPTSGRGGRRHRRSNRGRGPLLPGGMEEEPQDPDYDPDDPTLEGEFLRNVNDSAYEFE